MFAIALNMLATTYEAPLDDVKRCVHCYEVSSNEECRMCFRTLACMTWCAVRGCHRVVPPLHTKEHACRERAAVMQVNSPVIDDGHNTSGMCTILNAEYVLRAIRGGLTWVAPDSPSAAGGAGGHPVSLKAAPVVLTPAARAWYTSANLGAYRQLLACSLLSDWLQQYPDATANDPAKAAVTALEDLLPTSVSRKTARCGNLAMCIPRQGGETPLASLCSPCPLKRRACAGRQVLFTTGLPIRSGLTTSQDGPTEPSFSPGV